MKRRGVEMVERRGEGEEQNVERRGWRRYKGEAV